MINRILLLLCPAVTAAMPGLAAAQPVDMTIPPATTTEYPAGISVSKSEAGPVYVAADGRTLYGLDLRTVKRWSPDPALYCSSRCEDWEPVMATGEKPNIVYPQGYGSQRRAEAAELAEQGYVGNPQTAPDWTIIEGPQGPQWVYKGWHMVYVRKGDTPGSIDHDGENEFIWNTLKFIPPVPKIVAPKNVSPVFVDGKYALTADEERILFTGSCTEGCANWKPLPAGLVSRNKGAWQVIRSGDMAQWAYRGKPVFVSALEDPMEVPPTGKVLRP